LASGAGAATLGALDNLERDFGGTMPMMRECAASAALALLLLSAAGCQTGGLHASKPVAAAEPAEPAPVTKTAEAAAPAASAKPADPKPALAVAAAACTAPRLALSGGPPPVPNKAASFAGGVAENAGRNVVRNTGVSAANHVVGRIPGIGGVIGVAASQTAGQEVVHTAEDVRGTWTATDGSPACGCKLEFARPGMVMTKNVVKPQGCLSPALAGAARWQVADTGFAKQDLVLYAADGKSEMARLDRKGVDYFQGSVGGETVTVWR
jgi:hypothetical protein